MNPTNDLLRGELERLFELEDMISLSRELLGFDPREVGGTAGKGAFARALVERCATEQSLEALAEAILLSPQGKSAAAGVRRVLEGADGAIAEGTLVGPFTLGARIGEGGLGVVYSATAADGSTVALKVIRPGFARDRSSVRRFLTISRALKGLELAGLAHVVDVGELADGRPWVATTLVNGQTLAERVQRSGAMNIQEARAIFAGVLETLQKIHQRGLVHGHVKAENVLLPKGAGGVLDIAHPVLVDGGSDRLAARRYSNGAGVVPLFGTAKSLDPAVVRGSDRTPQADLYAVAVMLYETLTGRPPFIGDSAMDVVAQQLVSEAEAPSKFAPKGWVSPSLDDLVLRALSKSPGERFASATEFLRALEEVSTKKSSLVPEAPLDRAKFDAAAKALRANPANDAAAEALEEIAAPALAWEQTTELFKSVAEASSDAAVKGALLARIGRIHRVEESDLDAAKEAFAAALAVNPSDRVAHTGLVDVLRASGDAEALVDALLERAEQEEAPTHRAAILGEVAQAYEEQLGAPESAIAALAQALAETPESNSIVREIDRVATANGLWNDVVSAVTESAEEAKGTAAGAKLYLQLGRWYSSKLERPDFAIECFGRALESDPANAEAFEATAQVYRKGQNWRELIALYEQRAAAATSPSMKRDVLVEAARAVLEHLSDGARAEAMLKQVVADDPAHPAATDVLETIYTRGQRWTDLAGLWERRAENESGEAKASSLVRAGELFEDHIDDLASATALFEKALSADKANLAALQGLERIHARGGKFEDLYRVLEREFAVAATLRQKTGVLERMGALHEEQFQNRDEAQRTFEQVIALDPAHDGANTALARLYRQAERWDALAETYERHAVSTANEDRKIDLYLRAAETWASNAGAPARALATVERALNVRPADGAALEFFARLQTQAGDSGAALAVLDRLADGESNPARKAELWVRAGRLHEEKGDRGAATERYKKALDLDRSHAGARSALRQLYVSSGDAKGAIALLDREIAETTGENQKAKLFAELGALYLEGLADAPSARAAFESALKLDSSQLTAHIGLGDAAFQEGNWVAAAHHYEPILSRITSLPSDQAKGVALRAGDAFRANGDLEKAERAYLSARAAAPEDREVLERVADSTFEAGSFEEASELYRSLHTRFSGQMEVGERAHVLVRLGGSLVRAGQPLTGVPFLLEGTKLLPHDATPCEELAAAYEGLGKWSDALAALGQALLRAPGESDRFEVHVRMGDLAFSKVNDKQAALTHYQAALQIRGDARNVLTKLMAIYSETKAWPDLVEVILRIADLVDDHAQLAKYFRTVASIHLSELKKPEEAIHYYVQALEHDPAAEDTFAGLVACHEKLKDFAGLAASYKDHIVRIGKDAPVEKRAELWERLGRVYANHLSDLPAAIDALEKALVLTPGNSNFLAELVALYDRDLERYGEKARVIHETLILDNPGRVASYESLYRIHTARGNADGAWCVAQSLRCLGQASVDQKEFFKARRVKSTLAADAPMDGRVWRELVVHQAQDPLLTLLFTTITPVVLQANAQPLSAYRVGPEHMLDASNDPTPMVQALRYASWVADAPLPHLIRRPDDQGGLSFIFTAPPAIGLGAGAFVGLPSHVVGFVAARHLSYLQPGHYVRYLVPSGTGLKAWLLAAIRFASPTFQVPADLEAQVAEYQALISTNLPNELRGPLVKLVGSLLESSPSLDLKRWIAAVDKTADRLGFIVSNDLEHSVAVIAASPEDSSFVPREERIKELEAYCASSAYATLRSRLGVTLKD
jgi:tetratricopeptide (TPR) repeat protein